MRALNAQAAKVVASGGVVGKRVEVEVSRSFLGIADKPERYVIVTVPPR